MNFIDQCRRNRMTDRPAFVFYSDKCSRRVHSQTKREMKQEKPVRVIVSRRWIDRSTGAHLVDFFCVSVSFCRFHSLLSQSSSTINSDRKRTTARHSIGPTFLTPTKEDSIVDDVNMISTMYSLCCVRHSGYFNYRFSFSKRIKDNEHDERTALTSTSLMNQSFLLPQR
jgi:hypothetical protein